MYGAFFHATLIIYLFYSSHMEASVVETHLCNSIPICGDKALATEMSTVMAEAFNSAIPSIQGYVLSLISLWYVPDEPVTYYRTAFTDFIGATACKLKITFLTSRFYHISSNYSGNVL